MNKRIIFAASAAVIIALLSGSIIIYRQVFRTVVKEETTYTVKRGASLSWLIKDLEKSGYVSSKRAALMYIKFFKLKFVPKAGTFSFKAGFNLDDILNVIDKGIGKLERIIIPPALSLKEIGEILEIGGIMTSKEFLTIAGDRLFISRWKNIKKGSLEGFIYPETYFFSKQTPKKEIAALFVDLFFEQTKDIINYNMITPDELYKKITVASLIEEEAVVDSERAIISSVIYNRLKRGMKLQHCSTVQYALPRHRKQLYLKDLEINSPYNTYIHEGLTPTPICNPSIKSIEAAFKPAETEYLFYVSKGDGTHNFSKTYREHLKFKDQPFPDAK